MTLIFMITLPIPPLLFVCMYDNINNNLLIVFRTIGGYVKDRKWAEEADHVKKMIKEKEGDIQVRV